MSVLVKGMEMPELYKTYKVNFAMANDGKIVMGMCPLNETGYRPVGEVAALPDHHGRLVDENDVIDAIHERLHELQTHKEFIKKRGDIDLLGILPYIAKIQPIIEAEGEE